MNMKKYLLPILYLFFLSIQLVFSPLAFVFAETTSEVEIGGLIDNKTFSESIIEQSIPGIHDDFSAGYNIPKNESELDSTNENKDIEKHEETLEEMSDEDLPEISSSNDEFIQQVTTATQLESAISNTLVNNIRLLGNITISNRMDVTSSKNIDLNGNTLTMNGSAEFRLSGSSVGSFTLRNGRINGNATQIVGDGNNGDATAATQGLSTTISYFSDLTVNGNNFYNALWTSVEVSGDVRITVTNMGFRVRNFTAKSSSFVDIISSGGNASGSHHPPNGTMHGITMGAYATTGSSKRFLVESGGQVQIAVAQGNTFYNNALSDYTHIDVYGVLQARSVASPLRSTASQTAVSHVNINFYPGSRGILHSTSPSLVRGVIYTFPMNLTVNNPEYFDMQHYAQGQFLYAYGMGANQSSIRFINMSVATWNKNNNSSVPDLWDQQVNTLQLTGNHALINGTVNSTSNIFNNSNFILNNFRRIYTNEFRQLNGRVIVEHVDSNGNRLAANETLTGLIGSQYTTSPKDIENYEVRPNTPNATGFFTSEVIRVNYIYDEINSSEEGEVVIYYRDENENNLHDPITISGIVGSDYETEALEFEGYTLIEEPENAKGQFVSGTTEVFYLYQVNNEDEVVNPVDPLEPEVEVDPENKPELPEDQGLLSIDFASSFNFGEQSISTQDKTYYAKPQRLLNADGTINEVEARPNYVQVSDRRSENGRNGWQLAVTQQRQFHTQEGDELDGASIQFANQQLATAQGGEEPELLHTDLLTLVPGMKQPLVSATGNNGTGTWIYRFGDRESADESVVLEVPSGTSPETKNYSTTLIWELSSVPGNN